MLHQPEYLIAPIMYSSIILSSFNKAMHKLAFIRDFPTFFYNMKSAFKPIHKAVIVILTKQALVKNKSLSYKPLE